jgi:hypothetical protein
LRYTSKVVFQQIFRPEDVHTENSREFNVGWHYEPKRCFYSAVFECSHPRCRHVEFIRNVDINIDKLTYMV